MATKDGSLKKLSKSSKKAKQSSTKDSSAKKVIKAQQDDIAKGSKLLPTSSKIVDVSKAVQSLKKSRSKELQSVKKYPSLPRKDEEVNEDADEEDDHLADADDEPPPINKGDIVDSRFKVSGYIFDAFHLFQL